jgi:hypothetical protein
VLLSDTPHAGFTGADGYKNLVVLGDAGDTIDFRDFDPDGGGPIPGTRGSSWPQTGTSRTKRRLLLLSLQLDAERKRFASVAIDADMTVLLAS